MEQECTEWIKNCLKSWQAVRPSPCPPPKKNALLNSYPSAALPIALILYQHKSLREKYTLINSQLLTHPVFVASVSKYTMNL